MKGSRAFLCVVILLSCPVRAHSSPVADWLLAHGCTQTLWNAGIGSPLGRGVFHPEIPSYPERYGMTGRVNGSAAGGEWCTGTPVVGDSSTVGCWAEHAGMPSGYHLTLTDSNDLGYVDCRGTTACNYIRRNLGGEAACSGTDPVPPPPPPLPPPAETCALPKVCAPPVTCPPPPTLAAVPLTARDGCVVLRKMALTAGTKVRGAVREVCGLIDREAAYLPKVESSAALELVLLERCAP